MFGFPRRAATGNTMCRSSAGWRPSKSSEARTLLGLATSDSPTFAGLTTTGAAAGDYVAGSFRNTNAGASAYTHLQFGNDGDQNQGYIYLCSSTNPGLAGAGSLNIGSNAALGLIAGGTVKASISAAGIAAFYGSAPGTAGAGEVLIGGGQINAAGSGTFGGNVYANLGVFGDYDADARQVQVGYNGTNYAIQAVRQNVGYQTLKLNPLGGSVEVGGVAKFNGEIEAAVGGSCLSLTPGSVDHCYLSFYPRTSNPSTRGGYFGFAGAGHTTLTMVAELGFMSFQSSTATGTAGTNEVRIGAGAIDAAGDIKSGGYIWTDRYLRVNAFTTPASATDTGVAGTMCFDTNYIYVCTATNTWKRVAIATW